METIDELRKSFGERAWRLPFNALPVIREGGLVLGHATVLARMGCNRRGEFSLMLHADEERLLALLSAVYGRQVSPRALHHVRRASEHWRRCDKVLAQIELAFARFPRLETRDDAFRLFLAEDLLDRGMTPKDLMCALGFDPNLLKYYDEQEPREPAGNGDESGEWVKAIDAEASAADQSDFLRNATRRALQALSRYVSRLSVPLQIADALLVPDPNPGGIEEGELPGLDGITYRLEGPTRNLILTAATDEREFKVIAARVGDLYVDERQRPIGRLLSSGLYINKDALIDALADKIEPDHEEEPDARADASFHSEDPKLCPDPSVDRGKKKEENDKPVDEKKFDELYQEYVGSVVNPLINPPLPAQFGFALSRPGNLAPIVFDHCRLSDGTMIEAKGHYEDFLQSKWGRGTLEIEFRNQALRQIEAADANGGRPIEWHFYEEATMEFAREVFEKYEILDRIKLVPTPYPGNHEWPYPKDVQRTWARGRQKQ